MRIGVTKALWATAVSLLVVGLAVLVWDPSLSVSDGAAGHSNGGVVDAGDELVITMRTEDFKFVPDTVTIKVGQTVRLRLDNHDPVLHDYTTDEAEFIVLAADGAAHNDHEVVAASHDDGDGVVGSHDDDDHDMDSDMDSDMDPEAQVSLQALHIAAEGDEHGELVFEATEPGEYVFYCSVPGHREAGMVGTIIIEE